MGNSMRNAKGLAATGREQFEAAIQRIMRAVGARTQVELANSIDIRQSSISEAVRRGSIPDTWLLRLVVKYSLNPLWILHGTGSQYLVAREAPPNTPDYGQALRNAPVAALLRALADRLNRPDIIITERGAE